MSKAMICFFTMTALLASSLILQAGRYHTDFNSGEPPRCRIMGDAMINPGAGFNDSGMLRLTGPDRGRQGSFIIEDFDAKRKILGFVADFKMLIGGGSSQGADGVSFSCARKIPSINGESGAPSGLVITFDTFKEDGTQPEVLVKHNNRILKSVRVEKLRTGHAFVDVQIKLATNKLLTVIYDGRPLIDCEIPAYKPLDGAEFGFGARTGSLFDNHLIDELSIETTTVEASVPGENIVKTSGNSSP